MLDVGEDLDTFTFNLDIDLADGTDPVFAANLLNSRIDVAFSTGQQLTGLLQADPNNAANVVFIPDGTTLAESTGFAVSTADNSVLLPSTILANNILNFGGDGISVLSTGEGNIQNLLVRANTITGNFGVGANFRTDSALNAQLTASLINNNLTGSTLAGINATANGGTLTLNDIEMNSLDMGGSGILLSGTQTGALTARITNNTISNGVIMNGSTGTGVEVIADGATVTLLELANNTINTNAGDGVTFQAINSGSLIIPDSEDLNGNGVLDPGEDINEDVNSNGVLDAGEDLNTDGLLNTGNGNGRLDRGITTNSMNNNAGDSFSVNASAASAVVPSTVRLGIVTGNQILFNTAGTGGFTVNGINSDISGTFTENLVSGNPTLNPTAGPGVFVTTSGGAYDLTIGGMDTSDGNTISQTRGAGIAFVMTDSGTGALTIQNNQISGIVDDGDTQTTRVGDGISISLEGSTAPGLSTSTLTRSEISDNVIGDSDNPNLGTAGSGIWVNTEQDTSVQDLLIARNLIGNVGNDNPSVPTEDANGNGVLDAGEDTNLNGRLDVVPPSFISDAGIRIDRGGDSRFDTVNPRPGDLRSVVIDGNVVMNSGSVTADSAVDGLQLNVQNGLLDEIDFVVRNNTFSGSTGDGIQLNAQGDASLATDLTNNLIENNRLNGIGLEGVELVLAQDLESQGGTWIQNTIRNNGLNGIFVAGVSGDGIPLIIGQNGTDPFTGQSLGNEIVDNGLDGIRILSGGTVQINNNTIARNGEEGIDIEAAGGGLRTALIQNNAITNNSGTGIELLSSVGDLMTVVALGNSITDNLGRGVDILNQFDATANIQFGDGTAVGMNSITGNMFEGFYVVNTASATQQQLSPSMPGGVRSDAALAADGDLFVDPDMVLVLNRNIVSANNNGNVDSLFAAGGFSLRVGTSQTSALFATSDATGDILGLGDGLFGPGVGSNSAVFGNGRVNAQIINNSFEGNLGDDVFMESFVSTAGAGGTGATWNDMVFDPMGYQSDPLARLNLVFRGNVGNSLNVTNVGAFYNDGDGAFKSRTIMMAPQPTGPFTIATRGRNAQRIPARGDILNQLPPLNGPDQGLFQYPGMGASTFRLESDFDVSGFQAGDSFILDGAPIPPIFNANGVFRVGVDEMPYGWGAATPGTFQFDEAFLGVAP